MLYLDATLYFKMYHMLFCHIMSIGVAVNPRTHVAETHALMWQFTRQNPRTHVAEYIIR